MNKNYDYKRLTPFKWFVLQNFPFIDEDFDATTNYQLFCKLGEEMNKIIEKVNLTGQQTEDLTKAFNELKNYVDNYFKNLDVQDEINHKLDEMVKTGQLQKLLNLQYNNLKIEVNKTIDDFETSVNKTIDDFETGVNNNIENIDAKVNSVSNGSPLVANSIQEMTDTSKTYVLTTDGNWYYYNGRNWVIGGAYQITQLGKEEVTDYNIRTIDFNKVKVVPIIENFKDKITAWDGSTIVGGLHSISTTKQTGNNGAFLNLSNYINKTKDLYLYFEWDLNVAWSISLWNGLTYVSNVKVLRPDIPTKSCYCVIDKDTLANIDNPVLLFGGAISGTLNITNLFICEYNFIDKLQNNLIDIINYNSSYYKNLKDNKLETNITKWTYQRYGKEVECFPHNLQDFTLRATNTESIGSRGIASPYYNDLSKKLFIEFDIDLPNYYKQALYITENDADFKGIENIGTDTHRKYEIDLPYYAVYKNYKQFKIWLLIDTTLDTASPIAYIPITNFKFYWSDIEGLDIYDDNFDGIIKKVNAKLTETTSSKNELIYLQNQNEKFFIQVNKEGNLQSIPVIPNKTLIIGNSLMGGNNHGEYSFGMCASNINSDYFHYIKEYITNIKSEATFDKLGGGHFENAENDEALNNFLNDELLPKLNDELQLVLIQLGDNINTEEKRNYFKTSCKTLLKFIRNNAPNTRVVFVGIWYSNQTNINTIIEATKETGCQFVDISSLNTTTNQGYIGQVISFPDNYTYTVDNSGIASHPGDTGMKKIADKIINEIF